MEFKDTLVDEGISVIQALSQLDKNSKKVLFVVKDDRLVAALTDGDIRRWILSKGSLEASISEFANYHPKFLAENEKARAKAFMLQERIDALPIVNNAMQIVDMVFMFDDVGSQNKPTVTLPVVIMAGGRGPRLYPYTKILPKPLIPIGDIPIVEHIINNFKRFGCHDFYLVVNEKKNMIKAYFNEIEKDYSVTYVDEGTPLGTGGGLSLLKGMIHSTFILSNCDILIDADYEKIHQLHVKNGHMVTMVCSLKTFTIPYGVVDIGENGSIELMREKPNLTYFTNTGCYFVEPEVIEDLQPNMQISFPDIIDRCKLNGHKVGVFPVNEHAWMDMGQLDGMEEMRVRLEK